MSGAATQVSAWPLRRPQNGALANHQQGVSHGTLFLIAVTCGICVANNYYGQPLIVYIARDLDIPAGLAGLAPMATQLGIALGMLLILPLGDRMENRHLAVLLLTTQAAALVAMARASSAGLFLASGFVVGLCGIVTYLLPAYATRLVPVERRGAIVGMLATGILTGIMLGRSLAGIVADAVGWRSVYACAAVATLVAASAMARTMRATPGLRAERYLDLLGSLPRLMRSQPLLARATLAQALSFGSFNALWVGASLQLQGESFGLNAREVGELSLVAVTAAIAAPFLGRLADRRGASRAGLLAMVTSALGWAAAMALPDNLTGVVAGMVLIGAGAIGTDVALRGALYRLPSDIRMRLNAVYSAGTFLGGGLFTLITPILWVHLGWTWVATVAMTACLASLFPLFRLDTKV